MSNDKRHSRRHSLAVRYGWVCAYCRAEIECVACHPGTERPATFDHIHPLAAQGTDCLANLLLACEPCNREKADKVIGGGLCRDDRDVPPPPPPMMWTIAEACSLTNGAA